jgi:hypothetical protein
VIIGHEMNLLFSIKSRFHSLLLFNSLLILSSCGYLQVNPPPDVIASEDPSDQSAWLAAASNMLAAAGYGYGDDVQERADKIYEQMVKQFGTTNHGWTDAALQWWIASENNHWPENPYKMVSVIGNKKPPLPWCDPEGAAKIGTLLREGCIVSASISWPDPDEPGSSRGGHVLNCWGDDKGENKNPGIIPGHLRVTDCYRNKGGIIQTYSYDDYNKITQDGNSRKGWFISYSENKPFIKHIVVLEPIAHPESGNQACLSRVIMDQENDMESRAGKMSIQWYSDKPFLSFKSEVILQGEQAIPGKPGDDKGYQNEQVVNWNFNRNDLEKGRKFLLSTESSGNWEAWTNLTNGYAVDRQEQDSMFLREISWKLEGEEVSQRNRSSFFTGGYFIIALSLLELDSLGTDTSNVLNIYLHRQYPAGINPERPVLHISVDSGYHMSSLKAGHSYGLLSPARQIEFSSWMVNQDKPHFFTGDTLRIPLNMIGLLPYPEGENYGKRIVEK